MQPRGHQYSPRLLGRALRLPSGRRKKKQGARRLGIAAKHLRERLGAYAAVPAGLKHPDSWSYMKSFDPSKCKIDICHDKPAWTEGTFYHSELKPGEATHTVALANLLTRAIAEDGAYDFGKYLARYVDFWRVPGQNTDTYIEIVHRHFFERLAEGAPLHECGMEESCLSGFTVTMPLMLAMYDAPPELAAQAVEGHLRLTHNSDSLVAEAMDIMGVVHALLRGADVRATLAAAFSLSSSRITPPPVPLYSCRRAASSLAVGL